MIDRKKDMLKSRKKIDTKLLQEIGESVLEKVGEKEIVTVESNFQEFDNIYMSPFEKARILAFRAYQIANEKPIYVDPGKLTDPLAIAKLELQQRKIPITIQRKLPDGTFKLIDVNTLLQTLK